MENLRYIVISLITANTFWGLGCGQAPTQTPPPTIDVCPINAQTPATSELCALDACMNAQECAQPHPKDTTPPELLLLSSVATEQPQSEVVVEINDKSPIIDARIAIGGQAPIKLNAPTEQGGREWRAMIELVPGQTPITIQATDAAGLTTRLNATLTRTTTHASQAPLRAEFTTTGTLQAGQPLAADASTTSSPPSAQLLYRWDFGDGALGQGQRTSHIYTTPGEYIITLSVTDLRDGSQSQKLQNVTVEAPAQSPSTEAIISHLQARVRTTENAPIPAAIIKATHPDTNTSQLAKTDALGQASLTWINHQHSTMLIEVSAPGYAPTRFNIDPTHTLELDITLNQLTTLTTPLTATPNTITIAQAQLTLATTDLLEGSAQDAQVSLVTGTPPPTNKALDAQGQLQALNATSATYLSIEDADNHALSLSINATATLTLPAPNSSEGETVTLWHLNAQGIWVEVGTAIVTEQDGAPVIKIPIFAAGWWAIGEALKLDSQLELNCTRTGIPVACSGKLTHTMYPGWSAPAEATLSVPSGELCLAASQDLGACSAPSTCITALPQQIARLEIELDCPIDSLPTLIVPSITAEQTINAANPKLRWRIDGLAGQGLAIALNATNPNTSFDGFITLSTAQGQRLSQNSITETTSGLLLPLPYTGTYIVEVEANGQDLDGRFGLNAQSLEVLSLNESTSGVVPSPLTPNATLDRMFYYPGQGALVNAAHYTMLDQTKLSFVSAQGKSYTGKPALLIRNQHTLTSDVGPVNLEQPGYYRVRMSFGQLGNDAGVPYTLVLMGLPAPRQLIPDSTGHTTIEDELRTLGDRHIFTINLNEGDGIQTRLDGLGTTSLERLNRATLWIGRQGTGSATQPEESIFKANRDYGYQHALADHAWRAPATGTYTIEVLFFGFEDGSVEPGRYRLTVDKVAAHAGELRIDPTMQHPDAKTRSLPAALMASSAGAQLLLGPHQYELEVPLKMWRRGVSLIGEGAMTTRLTYVKPRLYSETPSGSFIEIRAGETNISSLSISSHQQQGYLPQGNNALIYISSTNNQSITVDYAAPSQITIEDIKITTQTEKPINSDQLSLGDERTLPTLVMRRVNSQSNFSGINFAGDSAFIEDSEFTNTNSSGLDLVLRAGATIQNNTIHSPKALSLTQFNPKGPTTTTILNNTFWATSSDSNLFISQTSSQADNAQRELKIWNNNFKHITPRQTIHATISLRDPTSKTSIKNNHFENDQGSAINITSDTSSSLTISQNIIENIGFYDGIEINKIQNISETKITQNTFTMGINCSIKSAINARLSAPTAPTSLPIIIKNNIIMGNQGSTCAGIELTRHASSAQTYTMDSANNLIFNLSTPLKGAWTSRDPSGELPAQDPILDPATLKPQPMSPAIDAVPCLPNEPQDIDNTARPQGARCDAGAHEQ